MKRLRDMARTYSEVTTVLCFGVILPLHIILFVTWSQIQYVTM